MSAEKQTEEKNEKVVTRYDRKMAKRKEEEEKERKSWLRFKVVSIALLVVVAAAALFSIGSSVYRKNKALNSTYVKVGEHELSRVEYDYYYNNAVNNYVTMYGSYAAMMGLDLNTDLAEQVYPADERLTWKDYFDQMAMMQAQQVKALADDAAANGFEYDNTEDMASFDADFEAQAESAAVTADDYYSALYGDYATRSTIRPFVEENMLASAYYSHLVENNQPADEDVQTYYEENKEYYDTIDYRSLSFAAETEEDADDAAREAAMEEQRARAEEMLDRLDAGEEFEALCQEYAAEDQKENYGGETDGSLTEGASYAAVPAVISEWMYDEARKEGDTAVLEVEGGTRCYVVEFISRENDPEATSQSIANMMANQTVTEMVTELVTKYEVTDVAGDMKYLTVEDETVAETESAAAETESTAASTETAAE